MIDIQLRQVSIVYMVMLFRDYIFGIKSKKIEKNQIEYFIRSCHKFISHTKKKLSAKRYGNEMLNSKKRCGIENSIWKLFSKKK